LHAIRGDLISPSKDANDPQTEINRHGYCLMTRAYFF
jgi:hypothetical protein